MKQLVEKIKFIAKDEVLRKRILFIFFAFLIFRIFSAVPIPGVNHAALERFFTENGFLGMVNVFSGGGLSGLSVVMLGVMPYITASIIMQLFTMVFPKLKEMQQEEGEAGRRKISNYSRLLSVPLAAIQAFGFLHLLQANGVVGNLSTSEMLINVLIITAGSVFIMWIGELISEFGIGNGVSLIIFAGIVASLPTTLMRLYESLTVDFSQIPMYLAVLALFGFIMYAIVYITEAERPVPVHHAKSSRAGQKAQAIASYIPIKLNQAGVIPIIFAMSIVLFPQMLLSFAQYAGFAPQGDWTQTMIDFLQNPFFYGSLYFILVFFFTYFYTAVTFDPKKMAENLQKSGTFVPGVRPGEDTEKYFANITTRVTFLGGLFLATVAVLPVVLQELTGNQQLGVGGISLLIVVSVGIDLIRKINAQISVREYTSSF